MNIESIAAIRPVSTVGPQILGNQTGASPKTNFGDWFESQLSSVNAQLINADVNMQKLATGQATNLHEVMISMEEAKLSLQMMVQVRNHLLEAYQDIMRMQI
ncbi:flagellar hook-basal body complex protein FliE [Parachitinimonas caeni]|uniref:Flagellar hook-basal body complex protein FliE n=1 Tax=Parachitinimonas caeni TaxID=3031301 RepID=A0ABT7DYH8_9NEIS|nr:flagellar hook-basal body complex protein FliE [Parachitinimonas caeni]MDK2125122.1 flagellar hook-basal body complex protein FliE [Parachitinimonas caeni]